MENARLEELLGLYFDEGLTEATNEELEKILMDSPEAKTLFWHYGTLNALMHQSGQESWGSKPVPDMTLSPKFVTDFVSPSKSQWLLPFSATVLAASVVLAAFLISRGPSMSEERALTRQGNVPSESRHGRNLNVGQASGSEVWVATLNKALDVNWLNNADAISVGEPIAARRVDFVSGIVEIQTNRGALIVLEGPAELELISDMEIRCDSGRLRVDVPPPAHGFLVHSPSVDVVDRGTSFAMQISKDKDAEVYVIDGKIELFPPSGKTPVREMTEGEMVGVEINGTYRDISSKIDWIPTVDSILSRTKDPNNERRMTWQQRSEAIAANPDCMLYFDFQTSTLLHADSMQMSLPNRAADKGRATDGTIVGCDWTTGRWPGKQAIEFRNVSDRVLFSIPGKHEGLTCIASVRLDAMDTAFNSLLMSSDAVPGELQWQISRMKKDEEIGRLRFGRRAYAGWDSMEDCLSNPLFRSEQHGTWKELAFVWDGKNGTCSQYVDGEIVSFENIRSTDGAQPRFLHTDQLQLGNWRPMVGQPNSAKRNFSGLFDEFAAFSRAFDAEDVKEMYRLGNRQAVPLTVLTTE